MTELLILIATLNVCHYFADYTHLSTNWMLSAKRTGSPMFPIFCHALVHALLMGIVIAVYLKIKTGLPIFGDTYDLTDTAITFQLVTHFFIDTLKGKLNVCFPEMANPANKIHWYVFGADQLLHQLVILTMVALIFI